MLERLIINNIAIIKDIDVSFHDKLNIISGDTGAGKSLVIDSLLLLSGNRAYQNLIRYEEKMAFVEAHFKNDNKELTKYLQSLNIADTINIKIRREIKDGRNLIKVNNQNVTLSELKDIANYLFNIHEQQDTFKLFNEDSYLEYIDNEDNIIKAKNDYLFAYSNYLEIKNKYNDLLNNKKTSLDKLDYLLYEKKELEELNLEYDEDKKIVDKIAILKNFDKIFEALNYAYNTLNTNVNDNLYNAKEEIAKISDLKAEYNNYFETMNDAYYNLEDIKSAIYKEINNLDYDKQELEELENRSYTLEKIKEKYKRPLNEIIEYYNNINYEIEKITNYDELILKVEKEYQQIKENLYELGLKLRNLRKKKGEKLAKEIIKNCQDLDLTKIDFNIRFYEAAKDEFYNNGIDKVNFLVSFNSGEPVKELSKVASGGELARLMLAIKTIDAKTKNYSLMVFDEIDTGVSGEAALKIANKIKEIAASTQVICITHIARVAAMGDYEYLIYKEENAGKTFAHIKELNTEERVKIIARMIAGNNITEGAILSAKELLGLA